jgi:tight adherence protein C
MVRDGLVFLSRFDPGGAALGRKLARAGAAKSVVDFRAEQVLWAAGGVLLAVVGVVGSALAGRWLPLPALIAVAVSAAGGYLLRSFVLDLRIKKRERAFLAEFPGVAELLALAVAAGESAPNAMERICRTSNGELAKEFAAVLADARSGTPFTEALQAFSARTEVPAVVRFVDGLVVAVGRGTPLADVLRAQAADVRDAAKRELMESAGRKEIGMMVPLVFGVLPLTVIFAAFPAVAALEISL